MLLYTAIMILLSAVFAGLGHGIYRGRTDLIHDYHQTRVTDKAAYGRAFGKAMFVISAAMLLSGLLGLLEHLVILAVSVLLIGLSIGVGGIIVVQRRYNKGVF